MFGTALRPGTVFIIIGMILGAGATARAGEALLQPNQALLQPYQSLLQREQMLEDLRYLSTTLKEVHPALADRAAQQDFAARSEALSSQLRNPLPAWEFFAIANKLVNSLQDAHTRLLPPSEGLLPVHLTWAEDGLVVTRVLDPSLPVLKGDELISLGGHTPDQLLEDLSLWIPHGNLYWVKALSGQYLQNPLVLRGLGLITPSGTVQIMVRRPNPAASGQSTSSPFISAEVPLWNGLAVAQTSMVTDATTGRTFSPAAEAGLQPGDQILSAGGNPIHSSDDLARAIQQYGRDGRNLPLEVLRRGQRIMISVRPAATREPGASAQTQLVYRIGASLGQPLVPTRPWFGWKIDQPHGYGLFWLDECNDTKEYRQAVEQFFAAVRKEGIQRIAIDLRLNGGGNSMVINAFLKHLPYKDLRAGYRCTRFSAQFSQQRGLGVRILTYLGQTLFPGHWMPVWKAPADQLFQGQVYVLTSWNTFSSATDFVALLSDNHIAQIAGEPTGGAPTQYGDILNFRLPNTGWYFNVSTTRFIRPDPTRPGESVYPDIPIPTKMRDIREGRDPVLEWLKASYDGPKSISMSSSRESASLISRSF